MSPLQPREEYNELQKSVLSSGGNNIKKAFSIKRKKNDKKKASGNRSSSSDEEELHVRETVPESYFKSNLDGSLNKQNGAVETAYFAG